MEPTADTRWERLLALLEPFHEQALATARRLGRSSDDGDDLYQETVLRAFDRLHTLRDPSRFRSWFFAMLLRGHRSRHRRSFWRRMLPWEHVAAAGGEPAGESGSAWAERAQGARRIARALAALGAEQREAIVLFELDGFSIEEIAELQGASVPAVKSRLARGRERLRRWYRRHAAAADRASSDRVPSPLDELPPWAPAPAATEERSHD